MKIFFGGSTQRFYKKQKDYLTIRQAILDGGHILTRDWIKKELEGDTLPHNKYYDLVQKAINEADAVVLDFTASTSSAGIQMLMALEKNLPTLLLVDSTNTDGDRNFADEFISPRFFKYIRREIYDDKNIKNLVINFLDWAEKNKNVVRFNLELEKELDDYLKIKAAQNNSSKAEEIRKLIQDKVGT